MFFKCKHPFEDLIIAQFPTFTQLDDRGYIQVTVSFRCLKCDKILTKSFGKFIATPFEVNETTGRLTLTPDQVKYLAHHLEVRSHAEDLYEQIFKLMHVLKGYLKW